VQVLVHGFTLSPGYFDPPYRLERYSYVQAANAAGYATLNLSRLGVADSDDPPATEVTTGTHAYTLHQVLDAVRAGVLGGVPAPKVVLVGHSYGTEIAALAAARFGGADAVVAAGFLHPGFDVPEATLFIGSSLPAQLDPAFASSGLPAGYVTTLPGYRHRFYQPGNVEPAVVAMDEATKQTGTYGEVFTFGEYFQPGSVAGVSVPVLVVTGAHDPFFCNPTLSCAGPGAIIERERDWFRAAPCLEAFVQAGAGHNISLELNNRDGWAAQLDFVDRHVGPSGVPSRPGGCAG
ncbi:MAG: alpha/beta fold hydrolase, partial [Acidimicrobiia bacterium]